MAQQDDMPKKKPGTESRLTMVQMAKDLMLPLVALRGTLEGPGGCLSVSLSLNSLLATRHVGLLRAPRIDLA